MPPPVGVETAIDTTDGVTVAAIFLTSKEFTVSSSGERPFEHLPSADKKSAFVLLSTHAFTPPVLLISATATPPATLAPRTKANTRLTDVFFIYD